MTLYICQCPHRMPAQLWAAVDEADALRRLDADRGAVLADLVRDDMRDAYVTNDPVDMLLWIGSAEAPQATGARRAFFGSAEARLEIESLATLVEDDDDLRYRALDDRFIWSENDGAWTLDNQPAVEAEDLFHGLSEAALIVRRSERMVQFDV